MYSTVYLEGKKYVAISQPCLSCYHFFVLRIYYMKGKGVINLKPKPLLGDLLGVGVRGVVLTRARDTGVQL